MMQSLWSTSKGLEQCPEHNEHLIDFNGDGGGDIVLSSTSLCVPPW